jgi:dienelactone hydrolase
MLKAALLLVLTAQQAQVVRGTAPTLPLNAGGGELGEQARRYEIPQKEFAWELTLKDSRRLTEEYALTFPSPFPSGVARNDTVHAKYWRPRGRGPFPAFVVLHWLAGNFGALETFCLRLAEHDVAALMVWMPFYGERREGERRMMERDIESTVKNCLQASGDARRAGHWLHARPEVDRARVGILGVSLGSFVAAGSAGLDDQFRLVVPIIGGGDMAQVLMHDSREVRLMREALQRAGITVESLRQTLRPIDPATWAPRVPRERVLMINMESDEIIPRPCTDALWEAFGRPAIKWYPGGHYHVALQFGNLLWDVVTFARPERWY